jgi:hypothetical protein
MRNLVLSSLLISFFILTACSPKILKGFKKENSALLSKKEFYPFFPAADSTQLFNMQIDFGKNHFSGILLVKSTGEETYRTVFNTHFGMSVFDFEFDKDDFRVNSCMEALNKKKVIQTLETDFKTLFSLNLETVENSVAIYKNKNETYLEIDKFENYYYLKNTDTKELLKIEVSRFINSLHYNFTDYRDRFPAVIQIKHSTIGLKMQLEKIYR